MSAALIAATTALLVFILGKVPGFTWDARVLHRLKKDLEVHALMPDAAMRDRLAASVEHDVESLLRERAARRARRDSPALIVGRIRLEQATETVALLLLVIALAVALFSNVSGVLSEHEIGQLGGELVILVALAATATLVLNDRATAAEEGSQVDPVPGLAVDGVMPRSEG